MKARCAVEKYWQLPPPEPSPRLLHWVRKIEGGWTLNRRVGGMGYYSRAEFFGVYLWEYLEVLYPLLDGREPKWPWAVPVPDEEKRTMPADDPDRKTLEELLAMGGKFYTLDGASWCDMALDSWRLNPATGLYERQD